MIKIDFKRFVFDHVWFGWYQSGVIADGDARYFWARSDRRMDRLWPMRRYGEVYPKWWFILWRDYNAVEEIEETEK